jgi:calcineurin-like phosphoesterase family protein
MTTFFTADTHFSHANIVKHCKRPFSSIEEHDEELIRRWNARVTDKDILYHLGDFGFGKSAKLLEIRKCLRGKIHLIRGNHDKNLQRDFLETLSSCYHYGDIKIPDPDRHCTQRIIMSHFPFATWEARPYGSYCLHGHSHGNLVTREIMLRLDVGVDTWNFQPVSYEEIRDIMVARAFELAKLKAEREDS